MRTHIAAHLVSAAAAALFGARQSYAQQPERTAEQVYKNIQVLKGVPASQFMNTMFFQRYALGVSCSHCHVGADWEKDDKPAKVKAREMIRMVLELNKNTFGGKPAVNCVSCHRGALAPQTEIEGVRLSFDAMLGPRRRPATAVNLAAGATVDGVNEKYLAALGGRDSLAKISSTTMRGSLVTSEGRIVPFEDTYATSPSRWLSTRHFGGSLGDFVTGFDGDTAWNKDNRGVTIRSGQARGRDAMTAELQNPLRLRDLYSELTVLRTENVGVAPSVVLTGTAKLTGQRERLYFDLETGLLMRRAQVTDGVYGSFTTDTYYENYQRIDGVMVPTLISQFTPDDGTVRKLSSVEHNASVGAETFRCKCPATSPPPRSPE